MGFADSYIEKNKGSFFFEPVTLIPFQLIVVIPCFNEPEIYNTLQSLFECENPKTKVAVLVVINSSEISSEIVKRQNEETYDYVSNLINHSPAWLSLNVINVSEMPTKDAGVGWARKIGMDWAIVNFNKFDIQDGIIVSLDADSLVDSSYLKSIFDFHKRNPKIIASTIYFEHSFNIQETSRAAVLYELYMRYFKNAVSSTGFPNSIYTVGSCFSVISKAYVAQGGMNRKKAGEDFYFLNKLLMYGEIGENNNTIVFPSSRLSDRVPFGTGPLLSKFISEGSEVYFTYSFDSFLPLIELFSNTQLIYQGMEIEELIRDEALRSFCIKNNIQDKHKALISNCSTQKTFQKRFFHLFDNFMIIKWLNFAADTYYPKSDLINECFKLFQFIGVDLEYAQKEPLNFLNILRKRDKNNLS